MNKNIQETSISKAKRTRYTREEQYLHNADRKESFAKRRRSKTSQRAIKESESIFPGRNSISYKIEVIDSPRNKCLAYKEEYNINNIPHRYGLEEKTTKIFPKFTVISVRLTPIPPQLRRTPPKKTYKSYRYVMKPFTEFDDLDWHLWHKRDREARGVYWAQANRRDNQRATKKPWDKYYVQSSQSGLHLPEQSQSTRQRSFLVVA